MFNYQEPSQAKHLLKRERKTFLCFIDSGQIEVEKTFVVLRYSVKFFFDLLKHQK